MVKNTISQANWSSLSPAEKKLELFRHQKELLDTFLSTGAIDQVQHDKSLNCLIEKMGIKGNTQWLANLFHIPQFKTYLIYSQTVLWNMTLKFVDFSHWIFRITLFQYSCNAILHKQCSILCILTVKAINLSRKTILFLIFVEHQNIQEKWKNN